MKIGVDKLRSIEKLFARRHLDREVILLCLRWYMHYNLSFRHIVEVMAERGCILPIRRSCVGAQLCPEFIKRWIRYPLAGRGVLTKPMSSMRLVGLSVPGGGQSWADGGLSAQQQTGRSGTQGLLQESNPA
jgi:hypothetical protein